MSFGLYSVAEVFDYCLRANALLEANCFVVLYSVSFGRPSYFFSLLCLYYYCVILMFDVLQCVPKKVTPK